MPNPPPWHFRAVSAQSKIPQTFWGSWLFPLREYLKWCLGEQCQGHTKQQLHEAPCREGVQLHSGMHLELWAWTGVSPQAMEPGQAWVGLNSLMRGTWLLFSLSSEEAGEDACPEEWRLQPTIHSSIRNLPGSLLPENKVGAPAPPTVKASSPCLFPFVMFPFPSSWALGYSQMLSN